MYAKFCLWRAGRIAALLDPGGTLQLDRLKVYKLKRREGCVERLLTPEGYTAVCKGFFKKDSDFSAFIGLKVGEHMKWQRSLPLQMSRLGRCSQADDATWKLCAAQRASCWSIYLCVFVGGRVGNVTITTSND